MTVVLVPRRPAKRSRAGCSDVMRLQRTAANRVALNTDGRLPATDDRRSGRRVRFNFTEGVLMIDTDLNALFAGDIER